MAICGGLSSSDLYNQTISDVLNLKVIKPHEPESVLLGSAILASAAASKLENNSGKDTMNKVKRGYRELLDGRLRGQIVTI